MAIFSKISSEIQGFFTNFTDSELYHNLHDYRWSILAGVLGTVCVYKIATWPRNLPPGPRGWPFIGGFFSVSDDMHLDLLNMSKTYNSDVVSVYLGSVLTVSLNSADAIREGFLKSEDFSDRGQFGQMFDLHDQMITDTKYDEKWRKLRSFIMSSLRTHGFGTKKSEESIHLQLENMSNFLKTDKVLGNEDLEELFLKAASAVLMKMVANQSYEYEDPELLDFIRRINDYQKIFFEEISVVIMMMDLFPMWLVRFRYRDAYKRSTAAAAGIRNILQQHIDEHRATLDKDNIRDYLDDCIVHFADDPSFTDRMITDTTIVFLPDGTETIGTQFLWCIFYLCLHPEYQEKMVKEMANVCGANSPTLKDRGNMVMCEAVMLEAMRLSSVAGLSFAHVSRRDVEFRGYFIPKGSNIQGNLYAVHHDAKIFPEPKKFKPERFIGNGKLVNTENVIPFGLGRRKCVGEPLTKSQIFLYLTGIVQRFKIQFAEGHRPTTTEGVGVFSKAPQSKMFFTPR